MINKNFPLRIRSVDKGSGIGTDIRGTYVDQKPYTSPKCRAWEPLRSSLGISLGDSLFVGGNNLIVEGITDQIILSSVIQVINKIEKKTEFDLNKVSITFAGDSRNLVALAIFCNQEIQSMKVLLDGDRGAETRKKLLKAKIDRDLIFIINEIMDEKTIDIENLFDPNFYHDCVLEAYEELVSLGICKDLPKNWTDIEREFSKEGNKVLTKWGHSKYYEEYFKKHEKEFGDFGKVLVSKKLADKIMSLGEDEQRKVIKPFEKLINKIWKQKPSWL